MSGEEVDDSSNKKLPSKPVTVLTFGCLFPHLFFSAWLVLALGYTTRHHEPIIFSEIAAATFLILTVTNLWTRSKAAFIAAVGIIVIFWGIIVWVISTGMLSQW